MFIAVDVPSAVKADLAALQTPNTQIKLMNPEQLHITVYFLGDTNISLVPQIEKILKDAVRNLGEVKLKLTSLQVIKQRMIWVRVEDEGKFLVDLEKKLRQNFVNKNIGQPPRDRPLTPHILVGKYQSGRLISEDEATLVHAKQNFRTTTFSVSRLSLYQSDLLPEGARHLLISSIPFGGVQPDFDQGAGENPHGTIDF